jgi:hypothetical protein
MEIFLVDRKAPCCSQPAQWFHHLSPPLLLEDHEASFGIINVKTNIDMDMDIDSEISY